MSLVAEMVLNAADVLIGIMIQTHTALVKDNIFEHVIIDETSVLTYVEMLCAWRGTETLTLIAKQSSLIFRSTTDQNHFAIA